MAKRPSSGRHYEQRLARGLATAGGPRSVFPYADATNTGGAALLTAIAGFGGVRGLIWLALCEQNHIVMTATIPLRQMSENAIAACAAPGPCLIVGL